MERGRWNGNNWGLVGPNGQPIEFRQSQRVNKHPPRGRSTGFNAPSGNTTAATPASRRGRRSALSTINLREGPRNVYSLLANKNLPNVVKEGLKEVLAARLKNGGTTSEIARALANVNFKNADRNALTKAMYETMNTRNLFKLQGNPVVNAIIKQRALAGKL
jgi:hypothetical protein